MSREEMVSRLHELEQMEKFHRAKVASLAANLRELRAAVEVAAVTMETDSGIPVIPHKPKVRDAEFERHLTELVRSETTLKLRVMELEKRTALMARDCDEAESVLREQEEEHNAEVEELEEQLLKLRKQLVSVKTGAASGAGSSSEVPSRGIEQLEELVADLEISQRRLQRQLEASRRSEADLRARLENAVATATDKNKPAVCAELAASLRHLEGSDRQLRAKLAALQGDDSDEAERLQQQMAALRRSESGLRLQVELLEAEAASSSTSLAGRAMLDTPEDVLRQRIGQLEAMERHLKQQVVELERDREELHEMARSDKNTIHDLSVQLRELQVRDKAHKDTINRFELAEARLTEAVDTLTERLEAEQSRSSAARRAAEQRETDAAARLADAQAALESAESQLKSVSAELAAERRSARSRSDEHKAREADAEAANAQLTDSLHRLESERAALLTSLHSAELASTEAGAAIDALRAENASLERRRADTDKRSKDTERRLDELVAREVSLQAVLSERECEVRRLRERLAAAEEEGKALGSLERQVEHQQRARGQAEADAARLADKLTRYEAAGRGRDAATIPERDLSELREQVSRLAETEKALTRLQQSEAALTKAVSDLRSGKDACGHEFQLRELQTKTEECSRLLQAHELLKSNAADTKRELAELQRRVKAGDVSVSAVATVARGVQVCLADSFHLRGITPDVMYSLETVPEFREALRALGAGHPAAYAEFLRRLQPTERQISRVSVTHAAAPASDMDRPTESMDPPIVPESGGGGAASSVPAGTPSGPRVIGELVSALPLADRCRESPLWHEVEGRRSDVPQPITDDYWTQLENNMGDTDDMMLTINFGAEDELSGSRPGSRAGSAPPPLPVSRPPVRRSHSPADAYFLPSADEASDLDDDDGFISMATTRASSLPPDTASSLPTLGMGLPSKRGRRGGKKQAASLDSVPDSGYGGHVDLKVLRERVVYLEQQVEARDQQIQQEKEIHENLKSKMVEAEKLEALKLKLSEKDSELHEEKKVNLDQTEKLSRTSGELTEVKAELAKVKAKLSEPSVSVQLPGPDETGANQILLNSQLERTERELEAKHHEVDRLSRELQRCHDDCRAARDAASAAERELGAARQQLQQAEQAKQGENASLRSRIELLEKAGDEKRALETIVLKLRGQLKVADLQTADLRSKVSALEEQLTQKSEVEVRLSQENGDLKRTLSPLREEGARLQEAAEDGTALRQKYCEMVALVTQAQTAITPLRAKVLRLAAKCNHKDSLLRSVAASLGACGHHHDDDLQRAVTAELTSGQQADDSRPLSPLTAQALSQLQTAAVPSPSPRRPPRSCDRDVIANGDGKAIANGQSSAVVANGDHDVVNGNHDVAVTTGMLQHFLPVANGHDGPKYSSHRAVKDYAPQHFSRSGHPKLELSLTEGNNVTVLGPEDDRGYVEAEVDGKVGLVPAAYLLPNPPPPPRSPRLRHGSVSPQTSDRSPELILNMHTHLQAAHTPCTRTHAAPSAAARPIVHPVFVVPRAPTPAVSPGAAVPRSLSPRHPAFIATQPSPPATNASLSPRHPAFIATAPPANNSQLTVPSPHLPKAELMEGVDLCLQTLDAANRMSRLTTPVTRGDGRHGNGSSAGPDTRAFLAVYDYVPPSGGVKSSAPAPLLAFCAGDVIVTYGNVRADGFYSAKVGGRSGFVPAAFIEEVALVHSSKPRLRSAASGGSSEGSVIYSPPASTTRPRASHSTQQVSRPHSQQGSRPHSQQSSRPHSQQGSRPHSQQGSRPHSQQGSRPHSQQGSQQSLASVNNV